MSTVASRCQKEAQTHWNDNKEGEREEESDVTESVRISGARGDDAEPSNDTDRRGAFGTGLYTQAAVLGEKTRPA